jgi:Glycosyl hydrolase family 115
MSTQRSSKSSIHSEEGDLMMSNETIRRWVNAGRRMAQRAFVFCLIVSTFTALAEARSRSKKNSPIVVEPTVTILLGSDEPQPVARAANDLANDFEKVMGKKPAIVGATADAGSVTILIGYKSKLVSDLHPTALTSQESFSISATTARWKKGKPTQVILLTGADMRGTIYSIYQFSQDYLGTDPMYYWTDREPAHREQVELPASLKKDFPAPLFKYRGFFINDEDLLTGWAPGEQKDHTGISLEVWNKIFETILRLKGNIVAPGTWIFPDDPQVKLAGNRGLIITQHHAIPLGLNVARWPQDVPYSYTEHPEILERAWKDAVAEYVPDQEVLWTVGLRGLSDASYSAFDPSVRGNDKALGELITKAIADQISIVRAVHPDAKFVTSLWQEGARLVQEGYLKIPPEVGTVWADTGYGYLQDKGEVAKGQGAYYHVAMMNGMANQLTEMVPMDRVVSELGRYIKAGATNYLLINTSDIRPVSMMTKAVMDVGWGGLQPGVTASADEYYRDWSAQEFGDKAASQVAEIYKEYFDAPAHRPDRQPALEYGDNYYHTEARRLLLSYMVGSPLYFLPGQAPKWVTPRVFTSFRGENVDQWLPDAAKAEIERCGEAQPRWDALWQKAVAAEALVPPDRQPFYRAHVLAMIAIDRESNRILTLVSQAVLAAENGQTAQAHDDGEQALRAFDEIKKAEEAAEYGKWKNWYRGDWLTGIDRTREVVQDFVNYLNDPLSPMAPPIFWTGWEAYYHIMYYEGDRSADVK